MGTEKRCRECIHWDELRLARWVEPDCCERCYQNGTYINWKPKDVSDEEAPDA
jgi:hypothetical protein